MLAIMLIVLGLAALYGFLLMVYYFVTKDGLSTPVRWIGSIFGGTVMSGIMALLAFLLIWPPVNILIMAGTLGVITVISGVILLNVNVSRIDDSAKTNRGDITDELDNSTTSLDVSTRP